MHLAYVKGWVDTDVAVIGDMVDLVDEAVTVVINDTVVVDAVFHEAIYVIVSGPSCRFIFERMRVIILWMGGSDMHVDDAVWVMYSEPIPDVVHHLLLM